VRGCIVSPIAYTACCWYFRLCLYLLIYKLRNLFDNDELPVIQPQLLWLCHLFLSSMVSATYVQWQISSSLLYLCLWMVSMFEASYKLHFYLMRHCSELLKINWIDCGLLLGNYVAFIVYQHFREPYCMNVPHINTVQNVQSEHPPPRKPENSDYSFRDGN
jgi:hypothetical protein